MKPGYLYVLGHPSNPNLHKIGVTVLHPEKRLKQHNSNYSEYAGRVVQDTGLEWYLKTYIQVPDPYWAEKVFWDTTSFPLFPGGVSVEIYEMEWDTVQSGIEAAMRAGVRPEPTNKRTQVRNRDWLNTQLIDTGIVLVGPYLGLIRRTEFQCAEGHRFLMSPGRIAHDPSCPSCGRN